MTEVPTLLPTRRYQWVELPGAVGDELIDQAIKRSIDEQLAEKGLTKVEKDADLYVGYQAAINLETSVNLWGTGDGFRPWADGGNRTVQGQTSTIPVGVLVVGPIRPGKKAVDLARRCQTIDLKKDPDKNYKNLQKAMAKILKNYPPQARK